MFTHKRQLKFNFQVKFPHSVMVKTLLMTPLTVTGLYFFSSFTHGILTASILNSVFNSYLTILGIQIGFIIVWQICIIYLLITMMIRYTKKFPNHSACRWDRYYFLVRKTLNNYLKRTILTFFITSVNLFILFRLSLPAVIFSSYHYWSIMPIIIVYIAINVITVGLIYIMLGLKSNMNNILEAYAQYYGESLFNYNSQDMHSNGDKKIKTAVLTSRSLYLVMMVNYCALLALTFQFKHSCFLKILSKATKMGAGIPSSF